MNICKDIYLYILDLVDDRTAINMLSVNKEFSQTQYFKRLLDKRYPLLTVFNYLSYDNFRIFFVSISSYISLLYKKFDVPYIPCRGYHPIDLYVKYKKLYLERILHGSSQRTAKNSAKHYLYSQSLGYAAGANDKKLVDHFIQILLDYPEENIYTNLSYALFMAVEEQQLEMVQYIIEEKRVDNSQSALMVALFGLEYHINQKWGRINKINVPIVEYLLKQRNISLNKISQSSFIPLEELIGCLRNQGVTKFF